MADHKQQRHQAAATQATPTPTNTTTTSKPPAGQQPGVSHSPNVPVTPSQPKLIESPPKIPGADPLAHERQVKAGNLIPSPNAGKLDVPSHLAGGNPQSGDWQDKAASYLAENGWIAEGQDPMGRTKWRDPLGERREGYDEVIELPNREGASSYVKQRVLPPASWSLTTAQALGIQHNRDSSRPEVQLALLRRQREWLDAKITTLEEQLTSPVES